MNDALSISELEIAVRLGAATLLGALVGLERERLERAAGLRTHAIVSVASALIMIVSTYGFPEPVSDDGVLVTIDPSRIAAQVVSGIGFLGAGLIVFRKNTVRGLTTAASIWAVAGIGLAAGSGLYEAAGIGTGFILAIQAGLRPIVHRFFAHHQDHRLELRVAPDAQALAAIERAVNGAGAEIRRLSLRPVRDGAEERVDVALSSVKAVPVTRLLETLRRIDGVRAVAYTGGIGRPISAGGDGADDEEEGDENGDGDRG